MTQEFHLSITPIRADEYLVRTEEVSPGVPLAEEQFVWPTLEWLTQARQLMNDPIVGLLRGDRHLHPPGTAPQSSTNDTIDNLITLGQHLYGSLFQGRLRDSWVTAQGIAQHRGEALRLRLGLKGAHLPCLPWEVLNGGMNDGYHVSSQRLATGVNVLFSRYLADAGMGGRLPLTMPPKPRQTLNILMAIAAPTDQQQLKLQQEAHHLQDELRLKANVLQSAMGDRLPDIRVTILEQPGREELAQVLEQGQYHIFHYAGHSDLGRAGGQIYLVNRKTGLSETLSGNDLAGLLQNNEIQLAVFNSCRGAHTATSASQEGTEGGTLTEALVNHGIPAVLAMTEQIPDDVAISLTRLFYKNLKQDYPVDLSLSRARQGLLLAYTSEQLYWALPTLYMHPEFDGYLTAGDRTLDNPADALIRLPNLYGSPLSEAIAAARQGATQSGVDTDAPLTENPLTDAPFTHSTLPDEPSVNARPTEVPPIEFDDEFDEVRDEDTEIHHPVDDSEYVGEYVSYSTSTEALTGQGVLNDEEAEPGYVLPRDDRSDDLTLQESLPQTGETGDANRDGFLAPDASTSANENLEPQDAPIFDHSFDESDDETNENMADVRDLIEELESSGPEDWAIRVTPRQSNATIHDAPVLDPPTSNIPIENVPIENQTPANAFVDPSEASIDSAIDSIIDVSDSMLGSTDFTVEAVPAEDEDPHAESLRAIADDMDAFASSDASFITESTPASEENDILLNQPSFNEEAAYPPPLHQDTFEQDVTNEDGTNNENHTEDDLNEDTANPEKGAILTTAPGMTVVRSQRGLSKRPAPSSPEAATLRGGRSPWKKVVWLPLATVAGAAIVFLGYRLVPEIELPSDPDTVVVAPDDVTPSNLIDTSTAKVAEFGIASFERNRIADGQAAVEELLNRGDLDAADTVLARIPTEAADTPAVSFLQGRLAWQRVHQGDPNSSMQDVTGFWRYAVQKAELPEYYNALGFSLYSDGHFEEAIETWEMALVTLDQSGINILPDDPNQRLSFQDNSINVGIPQRPLTHQDALTAYAGIALAMAQLSAASAAEQPYDLLSQAVQIGQVVAQSPNGMNPSESDDYWLWTEPLMQEWDLFRGIQSQ